MKPKYTSVKIEFLGTQMKAMLVSDGFYSELTYSQTERGIKALLNYIFEPSDRYFTTRKHEKKIHVPNSLGSDPPYILTFNEYDGYSLDQHNESKPTPWWKFWS